MVNEVMTANTLPDRPSRRMAWFRIAVPAWRFVGIKSEISAPEEPAPSSTGMTREEVQALFARDLTPRNTALLTEAELAAKREAARLRQALYSPLTV